MDTSLELIARRLKALADPSRLTILHKLCDGEKNVTELVAKTGLTQANVSKHLRILREEGLVRTRREQRMIFYRIVGGLTQQICTLISLSLENEAIEEIEIMGRYLETNGIPAAETKEAQERL
ncbi:MAG: winged helix-turn-helix transcriptional regulator [bacterium]|nr:MAG: winged helix-turn-helix transcriptional regulator [bacterium]